VIVSALVGAEKLTVAEPLPLAALTAVGKLGTENNEAKYAARSAEFWVGAPAVPNWAIYVAEPMPCEVLLYVPFPAIG
jgi:hypothetical protein